MCRRLVLPPEVFCDVHWEMVRYETKVALIDEYQFGQEEDPMLKTTEWCVLIKKAKKEIIDASK